MLTAREGSVEGEDHVHTLLCRCEVVTYQL